MVESVHVSVHPEILGVVCSAFRNIHSFTLEAPEHAQGAPQLRVVSRAGQIFHLQINRELES